MRKFTISISALVLISCCIYFSLSILIKEIYNEPILTSSVSFDMKMKFLKNQNRKHVNILAIGSSMTLNNFNSDVLDSNFEISEEYLNLGAWGLQITDILNISKYFIPKYTPKLIIITTSLTDFENDKSYFQIPEGKVLDSYFSGNNTGLFLKHVDINSYIDRENEIKNSLIGNFDYKCLKFDKFGGVSLDIPISKIEISRWNRSVLMPKEIQYDALKELINYLSALNIKLVLVQCPIKMKNETITEDSRIIESHIKRLNEMFAGSKHLFLNLLDLNDYLESDFCDTYHLNKTASIKFTLKVIKSFNISEYLQ